MRTPQSCYLQLQPGKEIQVKAIWREQMELSKLDHANDGCNQTRFIAVCQHTEKLLGGFGC